MVLPTVATALAWLALLSMPIETNTPVYFDAVSPALTNKSSLQFFGCLPRNGNVYGIGVLNQAASPNALNRPGIYKSTDNGNTYTQIQGAYPAGIANAGQFFVHWDDRGPNPNIITFLFTLNTAPHGAFLLQDFNLDTETWSAQYGSTSGPAQTDYNNSNEVIIARRSDGSVVFLGTKRLTVSPFTIISTNYFICAAGGNWTTGETLITADPTEKMTNQMPAVDSADRVHFLTRGTASTQNFFYRNLDTAGTIDGPDGPFVASAGGLFLDRIYIGSDGFLHMMWGGLGGGPDGTKVFHAFSNANLASPTWATETVLDTSDLDVPGTVNYTLGSAMAVYGNEIGGVQTVLAIYVENQEIAPFWNVYHLYKSQRVGGVWTVPVEYYNSSTNLPPNWLPFAPSQGPILETLSFADDAGRISLAYTANAAGPGLNTQSPLSFPFTVAPPSATLTLIKEVIGGTAVATDFTVTAIGAVDTVSGAGGAGPSTVTPGDFDLSEIGPTTLYTLTLSTTGGTILGTVLTLANGDVAVVTFTNTAIPIPPHTPTNPPDSPGGPSPSFGPTPAIPLPNGFDECLAREYRLYDCIDRELLACAKKPQCFLYDERLWGGNYDDAEEIGQGPPTGSIAFNPSGQVVLPAPIDGDVIIFSTRVPIGYDGIILGQFHGYYSVPIPGPITSVFVEGSGDIRWRVAINRRFAKDCGDLTVTLGTLRTFSTIAGGLQVRSGDLIQYLVNVPNTSGGLAPGVGSILAGLHGWFWQRR